MAFASTKRQFLCHVTSVLTALGKAVIYCNFLNAVNLFNSCKLHGIIQQHPPFSSVD